MIFSISRCGQAIVEAQILIFEGLQMAGLHFDSSILSHLNETCEYFSIFSTGFFISNHYGTY